ASFSQQSVGRRPGQANRIESSFFKPSQRFPLPLRDSWERRAAVHFKDRAVKRNRGRISGIPTRTIICRVSAKRRPDSALRTDLRKRGGGLCSVRPGNHSSHFQIVNIYSRFAWARIEVEQ